MTASSSGPGSGSNSNEQVTYPAVFGNLRDPKYPLLISKPKLEDTNGQLK